MKATMYLLSHLKRSVSNLQYRKVRTYLTTSLPPFKTEWLLAELVWRSELIICMYVCTMYIRIYHPSRRRKILPTEVKRPANKYIRICHPRCFLCGGGRGGGGKGPTCSMPPSPPLKVLPFFSFSFFTSSFN